MSGLFAAATSTSLSSRNVLRDTVLARIAVLLALESTGTRVTSAWLSVFTGSAALANVATAVVCFSVNWLATAASLLSLNCLATVAAIARVTGTLSTSLARLAAIAFTRFATVTLLLLTWTSLTALAFALRANTRASLVLAGTAALTVFTTVAAGADTTIFTWFATRAGVSAFAVKGFFWFSVLHYYKKFLDL